MARSPAAAKAAGPELPSREAILRFVEESEGRVGKREIARAFGVTGGDRIALKALLREMSDEGLLARSGKALRKPGALPKVLVLLVTGRDADGDLVGEPATWDEHEDGPPPKVAVIADRRRTEGPAAGVGDRVLARLTERVGADALPAARVIKVIDRRPADTLAVVRLGRHGARLLPIDRKQREIELDRHAAGDVADGELVRIEVRRRGRYGAEAKILERLGDVSSEKTVSLIAIHAHGIPHTFPEAALREAESAKPVGLEGREDWRDVPLITIDPADARDHDDAVHAAPDGDPANPDGWIVTVAIADVAHYVRQGSALDREALHRGNSVYFPDRVVPMLPERISNDLCSLREGEDRPAIAVRMVFGAGGRKHRHTFHRVLMRSAARLAYTEAQDAIDGRPNAATEPLLEPVLAPLWAAYACLKRGREAREPLELDLPERKIVLAGDGSIERVVTPPRLDAHRLIEEFMIQANVAAAETCETRGVPLIYRVHDSPSLEKLEALREFLRTLDINLPRAGNVRPAQFNRVLARVDGTEHDHLVNEVVLRSQAQAEYSPQNIGHFGLNLRRYAHFTSPIRRYADLVVHRALIRACGLGEGGLTGAEEERLVEIASDISASERRAMMAERDTVDRLVAMWLHDRVGANFSGRIAGVTRAGLFVTLDETGADGFVPAATLGDDFYRYHEDAHALIGDRTGHTFRLGDRVEVLLVEATPLEGGLRFEIVDHTPSVPRGGRKRAGKPEKGRTGAGRGRRARRGEA